MFLGYYTESLLCIQLSVATIAALTSFYYFNRPPAKIYMGEIGSCLLGLIYTAQVVLCYSHLRNRSLGEDAISAILIPAALPICELGISFLRRIYFGKTPFSGDKLHLHYILKSKKNHSVEITTTMIALGSLAIIALGYLVMMKFSPVAGFLTTLFLYCGIYIGYCYKDWVKNYHKHSTCTILEQLNAKSVCLITTSELEELNVKLMIEEVSKIDQDKKAA
jgi:UDP-GlcNAc:undecaprenyl-phosphate GlcNAc-1-phosphate transferase